MPPPTLRQGRASSARSPSRAPRRPRPAPTSHGPPTAASSSARPGRRRGADEDEVLQADRFLDREISWLQFNERVLQLAADENVPAARARPATSRSSPPTSTSSSWCGWRASSAASPPASPCARPPGSSRARCSSRSRWSPTSCSSMQARVYGDAGAPGPRERRHHDRALGRAVRRRARPARRDVHRPALPGAHAAGRRPGPPVPLHLGALAQPRRRPGQPAHRQGALRAGQGAAGASPPAARAARARRVAARRHVRHPVRAARGRHLGAPRPPLPGHGGARALHLPGHPQRGPRGRGGRRREPPHRARARAHPAPVRPAGAPRGRGRHGRRTCSTCWSASSGSPAREVYRLPAPLDLRALNVIADLERSDLHFEPVRGPHQLRPRAHRERQGARHLRVDPQAGHPAPAPVRLVLDVGAGVHRAGRRRPAGARHQADPLPHER